jgi:hypothetical protein
METIENQRVRDFLRDLHCGDPYPLRSYLEPKEAMVLWVQFMDAARVDIMSDLDILSYPAKFRQAVEDGIRSGRDSMTWEFWHCVRLAFLEYGGCYRDGYQPPRNE